MQIVTRGSRAGHTSIRENRLKFKDGYKRQRTVYINNILVQEDVTIINIYTPNDRASNYMKQKLTELKELVGGTVMVADVSLPLSTADEQPD